jgi:flagellar FliL protein
VTVEAAPEPKRGPSLVVQIAVLLVLTAVAAGIGWFSGGFLGSSQPPATAPAEAPAEAPAAGGHGPASDTAGAAGHGEAPASGAAPSNRLVDLGPITTNLAVPDTIWIRLELSLLFEKEPEDPDLPLIIQQDIMAYIRTVKLVQVQGASGYQHLKSDLLERARIRSKGIVKDVLVRTMIFE